MGGRRARNAPNLTPAEEEKRKVRRERNKLAAARCRKRRVDQTNELTQKVNQLESEKKRLETDLEDLKAEKDGLEYLLQEHAPTCRLNAIAASGPLLAAAAATVDVKPPKFKLPQIAQPAAAMTLHIPPPIMLNKIKEEPLDSSSLDSDGPRSPKRMMLGTLNPIVASSGGFDTPPLNTPNILPLQSYNSSSNRPNRPNSLNVPSNITPSHCKNIADIAGVSIITPSSGIFNFESLMEGGTGLTPVAQPLVPNYPMLSNGHRNSQMDLATPTTEPSKLVSL